MNVTTTEFFELFFSPFVQFVKFVAHFSFSAQMVSLETADD